MSDMLTHWAVFDDVRKLTQFDKKIAVIFKDIIHQEREYARLGALSRGGKYWAKEIVEYAMKNKNELYKENSTERKKIAFALGGLTHYAADIVMKKYVAISHSKTGIMSITQCKEVMMKKQQE